MRRVQWDKLDLLHARGQPRGRHRARMHVEHAISVPARATGMLPAADTPSCESLAPLFSASETQRLPAQRPADSSPCVACQRVHGRVAWVGFGRIVVLETEAPNMLVNLA